MALAARERGHEYLAITDHSASHGFGNEVSPQQLERQIELVAEANARVQGIELLAGSEVNVLPDGSLDYDDELLARLDWVMASVHTSFAMGEQAMTERMITAVEHPLVDAIGHPTGRKIEQRAPYAIDLDAVFAAAARRGHAARDQRQPRPPRPVRPRRARGRCAAGVMLVIDSDAHRTRTLANMRWGIYTARRAWVTTDRRGQHALTGGAARAAQAGAEAAALRRAVERSQAVGRERGQRALARSRAAAPRARRAARRARSSPTRRASSARAIGERGVGAGRGAS